MDTDNTLKSSLNLITMMNCCEDRTDLGINTMAKTVKEELKKRECVFNWILEGEGFNGEVFGRAIRRNHHYTWEGFLRPFILRMLQCFYAMYMHERLVVIKCLVIADKILKKGEFLGDYRTSQAIIALRHVFGTTIGHIFYKSGIYSKAQQFLVPVPPFGAMSRECMAVVYYMRAQMLFYTGPDGYVDSLKWTAFGLQRNPMNSDLRFLCLQLIYRLWDRELSRVQIELATSHLNFILVDEDVPPMLTFGQFYNRTSYQRNINNALKNMHSALGRVKLDSSPKELYEIELAIIMSLEIEPHYHSLMQCATLFFVVTSQPEKSCFMEGIGKLYNLDSAYNWLDLRMLLFPELCNFEVYQGLLAYHNGPESAMIYKRVAYHYVMYDPDLAFQFASKALSLEMVDTPNGTQLQVPTYDEKIKIFGSSTRLGFYSFMVYYAHTLAYGESARSFLWEIQKVLPSYTEAICFSQETQRILDLLLKNEHYRDPLRIPRGGRYKSNVLHVYGD